MGLRSPLTLTPVKSYDTMWAASVKSHWPLLSALSSSRSRAQSILTALDSYMDVTAQDCHYRYHLNPSALLRMTAAQTACRKKS